MNVAGKTRREREREREIDRQTDRQRHTDRERDRERERERELCVLSIRRLDRLLQCSILRMSTCVLVHASFLLK